MDGDCDGHENVACWVEAGKAAGARDITVDPHCTGSIVRLRTERVLPQLWRYLQHGYQSVMAYGGGATTSFPC